MKLMICVLQNRYRDVMEEGLKLANYRMTELASSGGFMRKGSSTLLIGVKNEDVAHLQKTMRDICLGYEEKKGKSKEKAHRYISFIVDAKDSLPLLKQKSL